jgi:hypothetical protein
MGDKLERVRKKAAVVQSRYYSDIDMEKLRNTTRNLSQDSLCPVQDLNQAPFEYKSRALPLNQPARLNNCGTVPECD